MDSPSQYVQAIYSFKGTNNDEVINQVKFQYIVVFKTCFCPQLCFKKGQIISITQREDGGWWEGTLDGKTGWFPSNYVIDYKPSPTTSNKMTLFK
jgi:Rho guanine nucleotide exchange factor 7